MNGLMFAGVLLGMGLVTASGQAQQLEVAARLGYQLATGKVAEVRPDQPDTDALDMDRVVTGEVPVGFELGIRIVPNFALDGYVDLAPGILPSNVSDDCDAFEHDCSLLGVHLGLIGHVHVAPESRVDPWFGVGLGIEVLGLTDEDSRNTVRLSFTGAEVPLRFGVDFKLAERFALAPYAGYTFGTFSTMRLSCEGPDCPGTEVEDKIDHSASHGWVGFGAKLTILAL